MRFHFRMSARCTPLFLLLVLSCNTGPEPKKYTPSAGKREKRTPFESKAMDAVVRGKVVYDGAPPAMQPIERIKDNKDQAGCLKGTIAETHTPTWQVDPKTKSVANVVVWLDPPPGRFFELRAKDRDRKGEFTLIDQPHCAFVPHVVAMFPSYYDGDKQVPTGQKLRVRNSAPFLHSIQWNPTRENDVFTKPIPPNGGLLEHVINYQKDPLHVGCGDHNWMHGIIWTFEHPYFAVTGADGGFEIKNVPTDVELVFNIWHETCLGSTPLEQRKLTLRSGANEPLDIKIKQ